MAKATPIYGTPRKILLATDLSSRGDRALDRAISLAINWDAQLFILHVLEDNHDPANPQTRDILPSWRRPPDALALAKQRIRQGLRADLGEAVERASVLIQEGDSTEVIEHVAATEGCELIITGIAHEETFAPRPYTLGKTVERLLRRSPIPVLIVRNRVRSTYEDVVVATDFTTSSGYALQAALRLFPLQTIRLLHGFEAPYSSIVSKPEQYQDQYRQTLQSELQTFLATPYIPDEDLNRIVPMVEAGRPELLLREYVLHRNADLVVLGTRGRGAVLEAFIGSTAKRILSMLPCDALVVRELRAPSTSPA